jgi:hypothetical protein
MGLRHEWGTRAVGAGFVEKRRWQLRNAGGPSLRSDGKSKGRRFGNFRGGGVVILFISGFGLFRRGFAESHALSGGGNCGVKDIRWGSVGGPSKVRPRLGNAFTTDEKLGIYLQVYNFQPDEKTQKPSGEITYEIDKVNSTDKIMDFTEDISKLPNISANQITIAKLLPLKSVPPGTYTLKIKATDKLAKQTLPVQSENFTVK